MSGNFQKTSQKIIHFTSLRDDNQLTAKLPYLERVVIPFPVLIQALPPNLAQPS